MNQTLEKIYVLERLLTNSAVMGNADLSNKIIIQLNILVDELTRPANTLTTRTYDDRTTGTTAAWNDNTVQTAPTYTYGGGTVRTTTGGF